MKVDWDFRLRARRWKSLVSTLVTKQHSPEISAKSLVVTAVLNPILRNTYEEVMR